MENFILALFDTGTIQIIVAILMGLSLAALLSSYCSSINNGLYYSGFDADCRENKESIPYLAAKQLKKILIFLKLMHPSRSTFYFTRWVINLCL